MTHYVHHIPGYRVLYVGEKLIMICYGPRFDEPTIFTLLTPFKLQSLGRLLTIDESIKEILVTRIASIDTGVGELLKLMMQLDEQVSLTPEHDTRLILN